MKIKNCQRLLTRTEGYKVKAENACAGLLIALKKLKPAAIEIAHIEGFVRKTDFAADLHQKKLSLVKSRDNLKILVGSRQVFSFKTSTISNCNVVYERVNEHGDAILGNGLPQKNPDDPKLPRVKRSDIFVASIKPEFLMWIIFEGKLPIEKDPESADDYPLCDWKLKI